MDRTSAEQARQLIDKYLRGECTERERTLVERFYLEQLQERPMPQIAGTDAKARMWAAVRHGRGTRTRKIRRLLPYAAAAAILLAVGWLLLVDSRQPSVERLAATDILPGGNRATLTLADGRVINLDEAQTGIVVGAEDITYTDGTSLAAVMVSEVEPSLPNSVDGSVMLSLATPKGGQYQITLPDGSKVWLNAGSTLKYPSRFSGDKRTVFLEGEAYFEIRPQVGKVETHNHASFNVQTANQVVNVLGTQFNISAYADDPETKTTLITGKVRVVGAVDVGANNHSPDKSSVTLTPGQQATTRGAATTTQEVDVNQYTAWKSGLFVFNDEPLEAILKRVARWYDVEVVYEDESLRGLALWGKVSRDTPISSVLNALALTGKVTFRLEAAPAGSATERRLIVMP